MLRSDAVANERPIWVRRLWSADGEIIQEAYPRQDQMGGWEVGLDFTSEGGKVFADLTGDIALSNDISSGALGRLAIVLDGQLESAPTVKEKIDGGSAVINEISVTEKLKCCLHFKQSIKISRHWRKIRSFSYPCLQSIK